MYTIKLQQFEGPLDLLLKLIEEEELDITTVSLAKVADGFLKYIEQSEGIKPEELVDFLVIAAKLLLLKSRILLPTLDWEEEEGEDLVKQLEIFSQYLKASKVLAQLVLKDNFIFARQKFPTGIRAKFSIPLKINAQALTREFSAIVNVWEEQTRLSEGTIAKLKSLQEKIEELHKFIKKRKEARFLDFARKNSRAEMILSFMALLELAKQQRVALNQPRIFTDIIVRYQSTA